MPDASPPAAGFPVVVQIGFAGPRNLDEPIREEVKKHLVAAFDEISGKIGPRDFLCGISQIAIGADTLFAEVCQSKKVAQRLFLPQPRDEYLDAKGSKEPDFSAPQQAVARDLLDSRHVIEERVVSRSSRRHERFEETNLEIARESDIVICVTRSDAEAKAGGTLDLLDLTRRLGKPLLEIRVDGANVVDNWHLKFVNPPKLPSEVASAPLRDRRISAPAGIPMTAIEYVEELKIAGSARATSFQSFFTAGALIIIAAHILATVCALIALKTHAKPVLRVELVLLVAGFATHLLLHGRKAGRVWAMSRLIAEIARSVKALQRLHLSLDHLFQLPYPRTMHPLLRTINVLHLASTRRTSSSWEDARSEYVWERVAKPRAQIDYYEGSLRKAKSKLHWAHGLFYGFSLSAFLATMAKLGVPGHEWLVSILGIEAILLPVLAVSALSLASSFDLEARVHTYGDTHASLGELKIFMESAQSKREFERLVIDTEMQLLGETATWASRRSFTGVS